MFHFTILAPSEMPVNCMQGTVSPIQISLGFITILSSNQTKYKKAKGLCFHLLKFTFFYISVPTRMRLFAHAILSYVSEQNVRICISVLLQS